jgi:outer membrane receptor for ferrienterochelin and colicins
MLCGLSTLNAQQIKGIVQDRDGAPIEAATVSIDGTPHSTSTTPDGQFLLDFTGEKVNLAIRAIGYQPLHKKISQQDISKKQTLVLFEDKQNLDEVVVSGTLKAVSKLDSPIPVEVYSSQFFRANPTPTIFESLQNINGVRPQINCSVCNTGDIHINGLEGPYTMVLIDGMPIVSGLSTVYGLNGIPQALIERVEIVKGPASTLYGSEAVGGLINIITKSPRNAPKLSIEAFGTSWQEYSLDLGGKFDIGSAQSLLGINYFNYANPLDKNGDNFTDVTLQDRFSIFNKWNFSRQDNKTFSLAGR